MLRLKGKTFEGECIEFDVSQVYDVCICDGRWYIKESLNEIPADCLTYIIDPATIQPVDDPRKAMLGDIRQRVSDTWLVRSATGDSQGYDVKQVNDILDELEAKL